MLEATFRRVLRAVFGGGADISAANPLEVHDPKVGSLISYSGTTTANGAGDGSTLIDSVLATKPDYDGNLVIITSGDYEGQARDINGVTTGGTVTPASAFGGQILSGVTFVIVGIRTVPAEVAALEASVRLVTKRLRDTFYVDGILGLDTNVGDATHPFQTIGAAVVAAGAGDRIHVCQGTYDEQVNLASAGVELECEPGTVLSNTTPGIVLIIGATHVSVKNLILDQAGQIGVDINSANFKGENIRVRSATIGFDIDAANPTLIKCYSEEHTVTGFDITESHGYFEDCVAIGSGATRGWYLSHTDAEKNIFVRCHSTGNTTASWDIVVGADDNVFCLCTEGINDGAKADAGTNVWALFMRGSQITAGNSIEDDLNDVKTDTAAIKTQTDKIAGKMLFSMDFWSDPQEEVPVGDAVAGATEALPSVIVANLPATATIVRAIAMFKFRVIENTNVAANKLNGATVAATSQVIQVDDSGATGFVDAINFVDDQFGLAASLREGGDLLIGSIDIATRVDGNDTYSFRWLLARADLDFLNFNDVATGIRVYYSV